MPGLDFKADVALTFEKARVASNNRIKHLGRHNRVDEDAENLLAIVGHVEKILDYMLKKELLEHPASEWFLRLNLPLQPIAKVIGRIEAFGRWYPAENADLLPVKREPVVLEDGKSYIWVEGIERLPTRSALHKLAGYAPGFDRPQKGMKRPYDGELKTMCYRVWKYGMLFNRTRYYELYREYKDNLIHRYESAGIRVLPTPSGRFCLSCMEDKPVPSTTSICPDCGQRLEKKEEPEGVRWLGHVDNMAVRWTIKLFLSHLWEVWRAKLNLPVRAPYAEEYLGHTHIISPWEVCDFDEPRTVKLQLPRNADKFLKHVLEAKNEASGGT
jgi:hypothetical protein